MKKIRILAIVLMAALMTIGAGYAAWADSLTVNSTVQTGELSVKFVDDEECIAVKGAEYVIPKVEIIGDNLDTVKVTLSNLYPGSWAAFKVKGINCGTIPVKFDNVEVEFNGDTELLQYLTYQGGLSIDSNGDNQFDKECTFGGNLGEISTHFNEEIKKISHVKLEPNSDSSFKLGIPEANARDLDNDNKKEDYVIIRFSEDAPNEMEKKTLTFTLKTNFKQHNQ